MQDHIGERVGAIISASPERVRMFGYGTYQGEEVPPPEVIGPFGPMKIPNPKILLDSGEVVWGCECWWGRKPRSTKLLEIARFRCVRQQNIVPAIL